MGSFNDLLLSEMNGHRVSPADERRINAQLQALREAIWLELH